MVLNNIQLNTFICVATYITDHYLYYQWSVINKYTFCRISMNIIEIDVNTCLRLVVFVIGYVLHCCFSMLVQTAQSTFTPTEDCTWQHGARRWTSSGFATFTTTVNHYCKMLSGAAGVLAGSSVGVKVLLMASLFHPCMVGSMSGGFASSACIHMQHCKYALSTFGWNDSFVGGRDINFGAETMFALAVFTFHMLKRTSDIVVAFS